MIDEYFHKAKRFFFRTVRTWQILIIVSILAIGTFLIFLPKIIDIQTQSYRFTIIVNVATSVIASMLLSLFLYSLWSSLLIDKEQHIETLDCDDSLKSHKLALKKSDFWYHDGHLGKWVREQVYPEFIKRKKDKRFKVILMLLNPTKNETIKHYSLYRKRINEDKKGFQNDDDTIREILITILKSQTAIIEGDGYVEVEIYLRPDFNIIRRDFTSDCFFETVAVRHSHAVSYKNNFEENGIHDFYNAYKQDFEDRIRYDSALLKIAFLTEVEYNNGIIIENLIAKNQVLQSINSNVIQIVKNKFPEYGQQNS